MNYFVVMCDFGRRGREAIVDPEITRREVISRIRSGEYKNIAFIHEITMNNVPRDLTAELLAEAAEPASMSDVLQIAVDRASARFDHARDYRKNFQAAGRNDYPASCHRSHRSGWA